MNTPPFGKISSWIKNLFAPFQRPETSREEFAFSMTQLGIQAVLRGLIGTIIGTILGFTAFGGLFLDIYSNLTGPAEVSEEVTIITIGPEALYVWDSTNPEPEVTPRALLAELVQILHEAGARTIVLDVLLSSEENGDAKLAEAARSHGAVIAAEKTIINQPRTGRLFAQGIHPNLQGLNEPIYPAQANLFFTEPILFFGEEIFRGVQLAQHYQRSSISGQWPDTIVGAREEVIAPSLSLAGAWLHRARAENPERKFTDLLVELKEKCSVEEGVFSCDSQNISHLPSFPVALHEPFWLHHVGGERSDHLSFVSASTLLLLGAERETFRRLGIPAEQLPAIPFPEELTKKIKDKLVIIGRVDGLYQQNSDRHSTTYSFPLFKAKDMAGVRIQAQLMEAILNGRQLQFLPIWTEWLCGIGMVFFVLWVYRRIPLTLHVLLVTVMIFLLFGVGLLLFSYSDGIVLELGIPITGSILTLLWLYMRYPWQIEKN